MSVNNGHIYIYILIKIINMLNIEKWCYHIILYTSINRCLENMSSLLKFFLECIYVSNSKVHFYVYCFNFLLEVLFLHCTQKEILWGFSAFLLETTISINISYVQAFFGDAHSTSFNIRVENFVLKFLQIPKTHICTNFYVMSCVNRLC